MDKDQLPSSRDLEGALGDKHVMDGDQGSCIA